MPRLSWTTRLAAATLIAFGATACGGDDSSGLATLQGVTTTAPDETLAAAGAGDVSSGAGAVQGSDEAGTGTTVGDAAVDGTAAGDTGAGGSAASETGAGEPVSPDEFDDLTEEERLLEFAQCMRDNGVDFPDPVVEADGTIAFGLRPGRGAGAQDGEGLQDIGRDPNLPAARTACDEIIEGLALGPGAQNFDELQIELMDRLLEFAQCMRDQGVDVADPDPNAFSPGGGGGRPFGGLDLDDADVSAAFEVCQDALPTRLGRGGGR